jgi:RHS repeat-associated protein
VYDASGNVLAIYDKNATLQEQYLYGIGRLGMIRPNTTVRKEDLRFEITDHLGSVRAVVTGQKKTNNTQADITLLKDYFSFGTESRSFVGEKYRYGYYNGKEMDEETGWLNYGFRNYNPTIARFDRVDDLSDALTGFTPYSLCDNSPIFFKDLSGDYLYAYSEHDRGNMLKALADVFGNNNGFSFSPHGKLVHDGVVGDGMTSKQKIILDFFLNKVVNNQRNHVSIHTELRGSLLVPDVPVLRDDGYFLPEAITIDKVVLIHSEHSKYNSYLSKGNIIGMVGIGRNIHQVGLNTERGKDKADLTIALWHEIGHGMDSDDQFVVGFENLIRETINTNLGYKNILQELVQIIQIPELWEKKVF